MPTSPDAPNRPLTVTALVFPHLALLDLTGPAEVLAQVPGLRIDYVWHDTTPVPTSSGLPVLPTSTFETALPTDILLVPGGDGAFALLDDPVALAFIADRGRQARWVTSVCTGAFPLAQVGLLDGRAATTHWAGRRLLARYGVDVRAARVVEDGNRITAGGVTSGIDFALTLVSRMLGDERARRIQLQLEYDPRPPYDAGTPSAWPTAVIEGIVAANDLARGPLVERALARR